MRLIWKAMESVCVYNLEVGMDVVLLGVAC